MEDALFCEDTTLASTDTTPEMENVVIPLLLHENGSHYCIYPLKSYTHFLLLPDLNLILLSCMA